MSGVGRRLASPPSVVQLPGGVRLSGVAFKVVGYDADGRPLTFEIMPPGERGTCVLYADEAWIRSRQR